VKFPKLSLTIPSLSKPDDNIYYILAIEFSQFLRDKLGFREIIAQKLAQMTDRISWDDLDQAKRFRELYRDTQKQKRIGWGSIGYGNCGEVQYLVDRNNTELLAQVTEGKFTVNGPSRKRKYSNFKGNEDTLPIISEPHHGDLYSVWSTLDNESQ
jgi:hypothetical protein